MVVAPTCALTKSRLTLPASSQHRSAGTKGPRFCPANPERRLPYWLFSIESSLGRLI